MLVLGRLILVAGPCASMLVALAGQELAIVVLLGPMILVPVELLAALVVPALQLALVALVAFDGKERVLSKKTPAETHNGERSSPALSCLPPNSDCPDWDCCPMLSLSSDRYIKYIKILKNILKYQTILKLFGKTCRCSDVTLNDPTRSLHKAPRLEQPQNQWWFL